MCCGADSELMTRTALYCGVCSHLGFVSYKLQGKRIQAQLQGSGLGFFLCVVFCFVFVVVWFFLPLNKKKLFSPLQLSMCICVLI